MHPAHLVCHPVQIAGAVSIPLHPRPEAVCLVPWTALDETARRESLDCLVAVEQSSYNLYMHLTFSVAFSYVPGTAAAAGGPSLLPSVPGTGRGLPPSEGFRALLAGLSTQ